MAVMLIYEHENFGGASAQVNRSYPILAEFWNDKISSIVVHAGVWRLYEHANYQGRSKIVRRGEWRNLSWGPDAINNSISSIRLISKD